jgi:hypothetical protein
MPDGNWIKFKAKNEELLLLSKQNTRFELTPSFRNEHDLRILIRVIDGETVKQSKILKVSVGAITESVPGLPFIIEIEGIQQKTSIAQLKSYPCKSQSGSSGNVGPEINSYGSWKDSGSAFLLYRSASGSGGCCVTCGGVKTCACAIEASCGSCCAGDCCEPTNN